MQEKEEKKALKEVEQGREARQQLIMQVLETLQLTSTRYNLFLTKVVAHLETLVKKHCLGCTAEHTSTTVNYLKVTGRW